MDNSRALPGQVGPDKVHDLVVLLVSTAESLSRLGVFYGSLLTLYTAPGIAVAGVESFLLTVSLKSNGVGFQGM